MTGGPAIEQEGAGNDAQPVAAAFVAGTGPFPCSPLSTPLRAPEGLVAFGRRRNLIADASTFHEPDEPVADVQAAFEAGEKGATRRPPGWCRWHQMVDCFGATPDCGEAQVEIGGGGDRG